MLKQMGDVIGAYSAFAGTADAKSKPLKKAIEAAAALFAPPTFRTKYSGKEMCFSENLACLEAENYMLSIASDVIKSIGEKYGDCLCSHFEPGQPLPSQSRRRFSFTPWSTYPLVETPLLNDIGGKEDSLQDVVGIVFRAALQQVDNSLSERPGDMKPEKVEVSSKNLKDAIEVLEICRKTKNYSQYTKAVTKEFEALITFLLQYNQQSGSRSVKPCDEKERLIIQWFGARAVPNCSSSESIKSNAS